LTGNDEFVFKDHTQTLSGKTLTTPTISTPTISAVGANTGGQIKLREGSSGGTAAITLQAPSAIASDYTVDLPTAAGTLITNADVYPGTQNSGQTLGDPGLVPGRSAGAPTTTKFLREDGSWEIPSATVDWTNPGTIGSGTASTGAFTTLSASGNVTVGGDTAFTLQRPVQTATTTDGAGFTIQGQQGTGTKDGGDLILSGGAAGSGGGGEEGKVEVTSKLKLSGGLDSTLTVADGGTGLSTTTAKAVVITADAGGTNALSTAAMSTNGQLLIGGTSGPQVGTLAAGNNITITPADGGITIAAASVNSNPFSTTTTVSGNTQTAADGGCYLITTSDCIVTLPTPSAGAKIKIIFNYTGATLGDEFTVTCDDTGAEEILGYSLFTDSIGSYGAVIHAAASGDDKFSITPYTLDCAGTIEISGINSTTWFMECNIIANGTATTPFS